MGITSWEKDRTLTDMLLHFRALKTLLEFPSPAAAPPFSPTLSIAISTEAYAHVNVLCAPLHVRFDSTVHTLSVCIIECPFHLLQLTPQLK